MNISSDCLYINCQQRTLMPQDNVFPHYTWSWLFTVVWVFYIEFFVHVFWGWWNVTQPVHGILYDVTDICAKVEDLSHCNTRTSLNTCDMKAMLRNITSNSIPNSTETTTVLFYLLFWKCSRLSCMWRDKIPSAGSLCGKTDTRPVEVLVQTCTHCLASNNIWNKNAAFLCEHVAFNFPK